jgi:RNA polymerase sigma-70 factor (ECF subfamily)
MELFAFDDDYVRRLREGDRDTEEHFHAYFRDLLLLKLRRRLGSMEAVDEVRQEVFVRAIARLGELRDGRKLGAFMNGICNLVLMEYYRASSRAEALDERTDVVDSSDPDSEYDTVRSRARVRRILATLPERDAAILKAVFLEEGDKEEICRRYDIDRDYLRVLLHRAKEKFRHEYVRRKSGALSILETFGRRSTLSL